MRGEDGTQGWRRSEVSPLQKLVGPWEQKGNLGGRRGSPSTDLSPTGPGGGGAGREWEDPSPTYPARDLGCGPQGRGGAWTLRPQSPHRLDRELESSGCPGYGLQELSLVTPRSDCQRCLFVLRRPAGRA